MGMSGQRNKAWAQRILPLCLCGFIGIAMISAIPQGHAESNDVVNRVKRLENEIDTLNRAVYKGEKPPISAEANQATADMEARIGRMENDIRDLTGKVEQQSYDNQQLQKRLDALEQDSRMRLDAIEAQMRNAAQATPPPATTPQTAPMQPGVDPATVPQTLPTPETPPDPAAEITGNETGQLDAAALYEQGFASIKAQDYPAAESSFSTFIKQYRDHALTPNAYYWLGETHYVRKEYDKASRIFAEAYQKYPKGPKAADNLLKLGMSLAGKGEKDNACIALKQLKVQYPDGPEPVLKRGDQEMVTLGCK